MSRTTSSINPETISNALADAKDRGMSIKEAPFETTLSLVEEELFKGALPAKSEALKIYPYFTAGVMRHKAPETEEQIKKHARAHEYIDVILHSRCYGSSSNDLLPLKFFKNATIYDPITFWEIPVGIKVSVPRWVAEHINANCKKRELVVDSNGILGEHGSISGKLQMVDKGDYSYKFVCA